MSFVTGFFMFSRFIYIVACVSIFISKEYSIVWVIPHVFINSSGARCSGCLHLLVFVNNAAMNICVQVFVCICTFIFLECVLGGGGISGS